MLILSGNQLQGTAEEGKKDKKSEAEQCLKTLKFQQIIDENKTICLKVNKQ